MKNISEELSSKWSEAAQTARSGHEWRGVALSVSSPVRLIAAVREPDERIALLLEGPISVALSLKSRFETRGLSLTEQKRPSEGVFRLAVTLELNELREVFQALCADLVLVVSVLSTPASAFAAVVKRLEAWQACLRGRKGVLSQEEQVGLLGELTVLRIVAEGVGYSAAVEAWKGPVDGIHDFVEAGVALEVKSVVGIGTHLHISRIDQLEFFGLSSLTLVRVRFRQGRDGKDLPSQVESMRRDIADASPATVHEFEDKLLRAGYLNADAPLYISHSFVQENLCCYKVSDRFPRLVRAVIPPAIVDGAYTIDEKAISSFREDGDYLRQIIHMKTGGGHG